MIFDSKTGGGGVVCTVVLSLFSGSWIARNNNNAKLFVYGQIGWLVGGAVVKDRGERTLPQDVTFGN